MNVVKNDCKKHSAKEKEVSVKIHPGSEREDVVMCYQIKRKRGGHN